MRYAFLFVALMLSTPAYSDTISGSLAPYVRCYQALSAESQGMDLKKAQEARDDYVLIRGSRVGSYGVYLLTKSNVYYQPFPAPNSFNEVDAEEEENKTYHYSVTLPGKSPRFVSYQDTLGEDPTVKRSSKPVKGVKYLRFHTRRGIGSTDSQFRQALHLDISGKAYKMVRDYRARGRAGTKKGITMDEYTALKACSDKLPSEDGNRLVRVALRNALRALRPSSRPTSITAGAGLPIPGLRKPTQK